MPKCFGDGRCIITGGYGYHNGYYKPYRCRYNCKLIKCLNCHQPSAPLWILEKNAGKCDKCLKLNHNEYIMKKIFSVKK